MHLQDFRDVKGDMINNRKTFPIAFGDKISRIIISICFVLYPLLQIYFFRNIYTNNIAYYGNILAVISYFCVAIFAILTKYDWFAY